MGGIALRLLGRRGEEIDRRISYTEEDQEEKWPKVFAVVLPDEPSNCVLEVFPRWTIFTSSWCC